MQRTSMSYMVGTIVVMAALGGIAMQNSVTICPSTREYDNKSCMRSGS